MENGPHDGALAPADIARQLAALEPIFHRPELGTARADFERMMVKDYWEVGASGRIYTRDYVLEVLEQRHRAAPAQAEHLVVTDFVCRRICGDTWLATYQLEQAGGRLSRRSTLWQRAEAGWLALYHQGTLIAA
ncbi:MAG TPA: hypothetical protein VKC56_07395 [Gallionellaceae bacterium]|nr:hypothetical protein [Gallionellaceae bacterium]